VGVPWPNEIFYYAVVSIDEAGNRSPISNIISVYISESDGSDDVGAAATASNEVEQQPLYEGGAVTSPSSPSRKRSRQLKMYIAIGVVTGLIFIVVVLVAVILVRVRTARKSEYDAERKDAYKSYEPSGAPTGADAKDNGGGGNNKSLSSWLDSLPRSEVGGGQVSHHHDMTLDGGNGTITSTKHHTLTKTNPYRHKVLTNGSFLNLKDLPAASSSSSTDESSRPTTSTEESSEGGGRDSSQHSCEDLEDGKTLRIKRSKSALVVAPPPLASASTVIDTSTAKAIIDTYSGNLFSVADRSVSGYVSYRDLQPHPHPHQQQQEHYDDYVPQQHHSEFGAYGYDQPQQQQQHQPRVEYSPQQRQSFRMRTE
jgi:hypothetical protein